MTVVEVVLTKSDIYQIGIPHSKSHLSLSLTQVT